jgi:hypothetical protein
MKIAADNIKYADNRNNYVSEERAGSKFVTS